jgi:hypothetical protein
MGYVSLLPNFIGYLSAQTPAPWSAYVLAWFALLVKAAAHTLFALRRFRVVVANDWARWWICLGLATLPLGNVLLVDNTTYAIWNLLWILLWLAYAPLGPTRFSQIGQFLLMALCICSHPLGILVAPLCLYNLIVRRQVADRLINGGLLLVLAIYFWFGVSRESDQVRTLVGSIFYTPLYILNRVVFESLFTYHWRMFLQENGLNWLIYGTASCIVGVLTIITIRLWPKLTPTIRWQLGLLLYVIGALTWLSVYTRSMNATSHMGPWNHRYFYLQQYLFLLPLAIIASRKLFIAASWSLRLVAGVLLVLYITLTNYYNWDYLRTWPEEGRQLAQFLQQVDDYRHSLSSVGKQTFTLKRDCFTIQIER